MHAVRTIAEDSDMYISELGRQCVERGVTQILAERRNTTRIYKALNCQKCGILSSTWVTLIEEHEIYECTQCGSQTSDKKNIVTVKPEGGKYAT
jgi:transcription elongation factor Elf1